VKKQLRTEVPNSNNALGRVMEVFLANQGDDTETLELKLDEAVMRETPRLERGLSTIKVFAAVAPLLGLLGTVTGMINTFQRITLFGTGDPKLMAGGISEALVTTMLGLVTAIPLVLLHSLLTSKSNTLIAVLDEQSVGFVAQIAEKRSRDGQ
jgi:biopolymer transport protein ExbB